MSRTKTTKTRYVGVHSVDGKPGTFRLWGQVADPKTGKKLTLDKIVVEKSALEANRRRGDLLADLLKDRPTPTERKKFKTFAASWLRTKLPGLKASTASLYFSVLHQHLIPTFGDYYLDQITRDDLLAWREAQTKTPLRDVKGRPMLNPDGTPKLPEVVTVNGRMRVLTNLFADAVAVEKLDRDPTLRLGKLREVFDEEAGDADDGKSITAEQLRGLLEKARAHTPDWFPFFYVLAFTGLRFGEITALKWRDVDEPSGKLWIRRSQWKGTVDTVKNSKPRTVPLMPELLAVLNDHRDAQRLAFTKRAKRRRLADITVFASGDWIFPSRQSLSASAELAETSGLKLMHNTAPRKALIKVTQLAGIPPGFTIHGFRHTFNNLVRNVAELNGQTIVLQAMTGHSSDEMTEHYSQVSIEEKRKAVGGLLRLVQGGS